MDIRIAGTKSCSFNNGPGIRFVVFTQGCPHNCFGCQNGSTHDPEGGMTVKTRTLAEVIKRHTKIDGVTLSGGEPFEQQEACVELLKLLPDNLDIWIYTGYKYDDIKDTELARMADFIVDGKFELENRVDDWVGGSSNQNLIDIKKGTVTTYEQRNDD